MNGSRQARGLTLVELIVVVAVVAVVLALAVPSMREFMVRQRVQAINAELVNDLQFARSESITRKRTIWVSFRVDDTTMTCYTIRTGVVLGGCDCRLPPGTACQNVPGLVEIKTVQVPRSTTVTLQPPSTAQTEVNFSEPQGRAAPGDFRVVVGSSVAGKLRTSTNSFGRPQVCTPDGSMNGVATCQD